MRFEMSDDQQLLRSSTRDFFTNTAPLEQSRRVMEHEPRGFEAPQWRQLAEMGYLGLACWVLMHALLLWVAARIRRRAKQLPSNVQQRWVLAAANGLIAAL